MLVSYDELPADASVWVHQSTKKLTPEETKTLKKELTELIEDWEAHDDPLKAWFDIYHNRFVVIMVDENYTKTSGCSIDESMSVLKNQEENFDTSFFDRLQVAYRDGDTIKVVDNDRFSELIEQGEITDETRVFNNLVQTKEEFEKNWEVPLKESWHKKVFTQISSALKDSV
jgi:hypothetical protein